MASVDDERDLTELRTSTVGPPSSTSGFYQCVSALHSRAIFVGRLRDVVKMTIDGDMELFAGQELVSGEQDGHRLKEATISSPNSIFAVSEELIYFTTNNCIRKIENDRVDRFAGKQKTGHRDGPRLKALFNDCQHLVERNGTVYVVDTWNHALRIISPDGMVSSIMGSRDANTNNDGTFGVVSFYYPRGLCLGPENQLYMSLTGRYCIRVIDFDTETVKTIAGTGSQRNRDGYADGEAIHQASFSFPRHLTYSPDTDEIIVADTDNKRIRRLHKGIVSTLVAPIPAGDHNADGDQAWEKQSISVDGYVVSSTDAFASRSVYESTSERPTATTDHPNSISLSEDGHLFWTEETKLRCILNFTKPRTTPFPTFEKLFKSSVLSDLSFEHFPSGSVYPLHKFILTLWNIDHAELEALAQYPSGAAVESFLSSLYDYNFLKHKSPPYETAQKLVYFRTIGDLVHLDKQLHDSTEKVFDQILTKLGFEDLIRLTKIIHYDCSDHEYLLWRCCSYLRRNKAAATDELKKAGIYPTCGIVARCIDSEGTESDETSTTTIIKRIPALDVIVNFVLDRLVDIFENLNSLAAQIAPDFEMKIPFVNQLRESDHTQFHLFRAHTCLLYCRWPWYQSLLQSGLQEANNGSVTLPSDFPPTFLQILLRFIYTSKFERKDISIEDSIFLESSGALYRLFDFEGSITEGFNVLVKESLWKAKQAAEKRKSEV